MKKDRVIEALNQVIAAVKDLPESETTENARFKVLSDGWVFDKVLKIEWGPSSGKRMNFKDAEKWAEHDGRLPTVKELSSLVDYERREPAIDTQFFPDTKIDDWYWTGTVVAGGPGDAWCVSFDYGNVYDGNKDFHFYVRPVRASQCLMV